jgi:DNA-binding GntR family transcriptional regulator
MQYGLCIIHNREIKMLDEFKTKKDMALGRLTHAIQTGQYKPGDRLRQNELAKNFGLSSTPVREALLELQSIGLVTYEAHRGVRVASLDIGRIKRVYTARHIVERETARLAFPNITPLLIGALDSLIDEMDACLSTSDFDGLISADVAFHLTMLEASGNEFLVKSATDLWNSFPKYFTWNIGNRLEESMQEHRAMVNALRARDEKQFAYEIERHIQHSCDVMIEHLSSTAPKSPN